MSTINLGKVRPVQKGLWNAAHVYDAYDWVTYAGSAWLALKDVPANYEPNSQPEFWVVFGAKGDAGVDGLVGDVGPQGPQGVPGVDGRNGVDGANGALGPQGPQGVTGPQGVAGPQGPIGPAVPLSNSVTSTSQTDAASSLAVKMAYDKGIEGINAANGKAPGGFGLGAAAKQVKTIQEMGAAGGWYQINRTVAPITISGVTLPTGRLLLGYARIHAAGIYYKIDLVDWDLGLRYEYMHAHGTEVLKLLPSGITDSVALVDSYTAASATAVKTAHDQAVAATNIANHVAYTMIPTKADLVSPTFTGRPSAPTQDLGAADTRIATTSWVKQIVGSSASGAPRPQTAVGVGQWVSLGAVLPSGGSWAFGCSRVVGQEGGVSYGYNGIAAGGTILFPQYMDNDWGMVWPKVTGFAWRIA